MGKALRKVRDVLRKKREPQPPAQDEVLKAARYKRKGNDLQQLSEFDRLIQPPAGPDNRQV